jgi:hypothetical protein
MNSFLDKKTPLAYTLHPRRFITVAETQLFIRQSAAIWTDAERNACVQALAVALRQAYGRS